jgi:hypothetical protein
MNTFDKINMISQPLELKINLYPHQLASIYNMEKLEKEKKIEGEISIIRLEGATKVTDTIVGINGDETGYGKSLSLIGLILRDKMGWNINEPYITEKIITYSGGRVKEKRIERYEPINTTLILASPSIISQWYKDFKYTNLKVLLITKRNEIKELIPENYDVIIVIPKMYNNLLETCPNLAWKRFIYDEPGHIKVPSMRNIVAGFYWLITATPHDIVEQHKHCTNSFMYELICNKKSNMSLSEFYSVFGKLIIKNTHEFIRKSFEMPQTNHYTYKCYNPLYKAMKGIAQPKIIEMINGGDILNAIKLLGGKSTDNITLLIKKQKKEELREIETEIKISEIRNNNERKEHWINRKRRIEKQIIELEERYKEMLEGDCNICYDKIESAVIEPNCQNIFCGKCLLTWLNTKSTCPLCRNIVDTKDLIIETSIKEEKKDISNEPTILTKENQIIKLITSNKEGKFIVYSAHDNSFIPIRNILREYNIEYYEIKGNTQSRHTYLENYRNGNVKVLFLNSLIESAGINLVETTDIIIYHEMSESTLTQIKGRANRIGRKIPLNVHHLVLE